MTNKQKPLIWNNFDTGIAEHPSKGHGLFRNADIDSFPGAVKPNKKPATYFHKINTVTFTAVAATDVCTASDSIEANASNFTGAAVYFTTTDTLPTGLAVDTLYYISRVGTTTDEFKVCTSYKNSVGSAADTFINITDTGTGVHTMTQVAIGDIKHIVQDMGTENEYMLCSNGRVWFAPTSSRAYLLANTALDTPDTGVSSAKGNGLVISRFSSTSHTYLFVFRSGKIDVINIYNDLAIEALGWVNSWEDLNSNSTSSNSHEAIKGQDDIIYFCDDRYIGSIIENVGSTFDPDTGATYTYNNQALDLPNQEVAYCLEELGTNLLIGGRFNKIYPWDRISDSFDNPIFVPEYIIYKLKNLGSTIYILAGKSGTIYKTQGSYVLEHVKLPEHLTKNSSTILKNVVEWGGIAINNGDILVGAYFPITEENSGIWRIKENGRITIENIPSTEAGNVYSIYSSDGIFFIFGYEGGADNFSDLVSYTNDETVVQSPLYQIANNTEKGAFSKAEIVLDRIPTGGSATLGYRNNISGSFTDIGTVNDDSTNQIFRIEDIGLTDIDSIQLQLEISSGKFTILEVRLFP